MSDAILLLLYWQLVVAVDKVNIAIIIRPLAIKFMLGIDSVLEERSRIRRRKTSQFSPY